MQPPPVTSSGAEREDIMEHYNIYYNDGVYAETFSFIPGLDAKQKRAYIEKTIREYNKNPNPAWHITKKNIIKQEVTE
jgi:hypothetical protein